MIKTVSYVVLLLAIMAIFFSMGYQNAQKSTILTEDECTDEMAAACAVYIERTAKSCAKAFATEGAGIISDIKCVKDLEIDKKKCWPCLCAEAKKEGWHNLDC